jgi:hypothetical protein
MMVRVLAVVFVVAALIAGGLGSGISSAQEVVSVKVRVVNGTAGAEPTVALSILLLATGLDGRVAATAQGQTDEFGAFEFGDLPLLNGGQYVFSVDYAGVLYTEVLLPEELSEGVQIDVYETTRDVTVVQFRRQVMVVAGVDPSEREISAIEFVLLANDSDRTLLPDVSNPAMMSFLRFSLPPGTHDLDVQSNLPSREIISVGTGFAVTSPVIPGGHSVEFSYIFPYEGDTISYRQPLLQGAEVYQVLVPDRLAPVGVGGLDKVEPVHIQDTRYQAWEGRSISPGQGVELELMALPEPSLTDRIEKTVTSASLWHVMLPGALAAFLAVLVLFSALQGRSGLGTVQEAAGEPGEDIFPDRESMIQEIADLDDRFEKGELIDSEYRERRQSLKSSILEDMEQTPDRTPEQALERTPDRS